MTPTRPRGIPACKLSVTRLPHALHAQRAAKLPGAVEVIE
jgi:hypothetical protein